MKITPDMVVAVKTSSITCEGCVAFKNRKLCNTLAPGFECNVIYKLKPEHEQSVQSKSELYRQQVLRGESVPRSQLETIVQEQQARIAAFEATANRMQKSFDLSLEIIESGADKAKRIAELEAELAKYQSSEFHPDWSMLQAAQESLREHMQIIKDLQIDLAKYKNQEPVAWIEHHKAGDNLNWEEVSHSYAKATPLYTNKFEEN